MVGRTGEVERAQQAAEAHALAPDGCAATGCAWYHGIWPTLRLLGLVASPDRHADHFAAALAAAPRRGAAEGRVRRVLVAGLADAGMLEVVLDADPAAALTVVDRCRTPVTIACAAAARRGATAAGVVVDLFELGIEAHLGHRVDAVVTHGLLGLVPDARRPQLLDRWAAALEPGGVAATTVTLAGPDAPAVRRFDPAAADVFAHLAGEAAAAAPPGLLPMAPADVAAGARAWALAAESHPVRSAAALAAQFEAAGFAAEVAVRERSGGVPAGAAGPWSARAATYLEVVAVRR